MATQIFHIQKDDTVDLSPGFVNLDPSDTVTYSVTDEDILSVTSQGVVTVTNAAQPGNVTGVRVSSAQQGYLTSFFFIVVASDGNNLTAVEDDVTIDVKPDSIITFVKADPNTKVQIRNDLNVVVSEINVTSFGFARVVAKREDVAVANTDTVYLKVARVINDEAKATVVNMSESRVIKETTNSIALPPEEKQELKTPLPTTTRPPSTTTTTTTSTTTTTTTTAAPVTYSVSVGSGFLISSVTVSGTPAVGVYTLVLSNSGNPSYNYILTLKNSSDATVGTPYNNPSLPEGAYTVGGLSIYLSSSIPSWILQAGSSQTITVSAQAANLGYGEGQYGDGGYGQ